MSEIMENRKTKPNMPITSNTMATSSSTAPDQGSMLSDMFESEFMKSINTIPTKLIEQLMGDALVACGVTFGVAPFISVVDKAIVQRAAGSHTVLRSAVETTSGIIRNPISFVKSPMFLMMWGVYAATYTTANSLKTITEHMSQNTEEADKTGHSDKIGKSVIFAGTTVVNSTTTLMKDQAYAKMFGTIGSASRVPLISYGLWASRDCMVIGSSFILPEIVSDSFVKQGMEKSKALTISQMACPVLTQAIAGPVQLLGLDFYNRPLLHLSYAQAFKERVQLLGEKFFSIFGARVARIAPAYGIGGVGNTYFRNEWRKRIDKKYVK